MRKHLTVLASIAVLGGTALLASITLMAAGGQRRTSPQTAPNYDVAKEVTLTGAVARQVTRGEVTMTFRDEKGFPRWSGRGGF